MTIQPTSPSLLTNRIEVSPHKIKLSLTTAGLGILGSLIPIAALFQRILLHPSSLYIGSNQDSAQFMWYLGWFWHAVTHGQNLFVTGAVNYPIGLNLMKSTSSLIQSFLFGPLFYLVNPVFAFNSAMAGAMLFTGIMGMFMLRELGLSKWLVVVGGMLIEFSPYLTAQSSNGHLNLIWGPVFVLASITVLIRQLTSHTRSPVLGGIFLGLLMGALFYTSTEVFATFNAISVLFLILSLIVSPIQTQRILQGGFLRFIAAFVGVFFISASLGLYEFFFGLHITPFTKSIVPAGVYVTDLFSPLIPTGNYFLLV